MSAFAALICVFVIPNSLAARLGGAEQNEPAKSAMQDKWAALKLRMGVLNNPVTTASPHVVEEQAQTKDLHKASFIEHSNATSEANQTQSTVTTTTKAPKVQWVKTGMGQYIPVTIAPPMPEIDEAALQKKSLLAKAKEGTKKETGLSTLGSLTVGRNCEGSHDSLEQSNPLPNVRIIFVNEENKMARRDCVEKQLERQCLTAARFPGVTFERSPMEIISDPANKQCASHGLDQAKAISSGRLVMSVGEAAANQRKVGEILAEWCSHYRLLDLIQNDYQVMAAKQNTNETVDHSYDYVLMLDDTVVISETEFVPVIKDFIQNYTAKEWDMVQFDAYGPNGLVEKPDVHDQTAILETFREKMVFKPKQASGHFWGFQTVLFKAKSLPLILEKMASMKVMPIDFVAKEINEKHFKNLTALTYQAGITRSLRFSDHSRKTETIKQPGYCIDLEM